MSTNSNPFPRKPTALVLAGGGARGAYEVGVLSYLYNELAQKQGVRVGFDIFAGTSVGAINVSYLAATADRQIEGAASLEEFWRNLMMSRVFRLFGPRTDSVADFDHGWPVAFGKSATWATSQGNGPSSCGWAF